MKMFMLKQKVRKLRTVNRIALVVIAGAILAGAGLGVGYVKADQFDQQIEQLQQQNNSNQSASDSLAAQASSYQDAVSKLQTQVGALQQAIVANQRSSDDLNAQIATAQAQLDQEKKTLGENIKAMYLEGDVSTLEMLASSNNISTFVNRQTYRNSVQSQVTDTLDKINSLKAQLTQRQKELAETIKTEQAQQSQLAGAQYQQSQMLAYTEGQKAAYDQQTQANNSKIAQLRQAQIIANSRNVIGLTTYGGACGGGYPRNATGPYGIWGCNYPQDNTIDNWGMYNRECVSYTAFRVAASGRYMPNWGGFGNANQWPANARAAGIPMDYGGNAQVGDIAISTAGTWGHAMYVESVNGDGTVTVSQYNQNYDGNYSVNTRSESTLYFLHF